jgi:hypothetical protein
MMIIFGWNQWPAATFGGGTHLVRLSTQVQGAKYDAPGCRGSPELEIWLVAMRRLSSSCRRQSGQGPLRW